MKEEVNCPNCGALIPADAIICPYCQYENEELAKQAEEDKIEDLIEDHNEEVKRLPKKLVKKNTKVFAVVIIVLVIILFSAVYMLNRTGRLIQESKYTSKENLVDKLEEYYQAGDYEKVTDTYLDSNGWGGSFGKYANTADVYIDCHYAVESLKMAAEARGYTNEQRENDLKDALRESIWALIHAQKFRDEGFNYGEGKAVDTLSGEVEDTLKNVWGITDQELANAKEVYVDKNTDYSELAHILVERKMGNN